MQNDAESRDLWQRSIGNIFVKHIVIHLMIPSCAKLEVSCEFVLGLRNSDAEAFQICLSSAQHFPPPTKVGLKLVWRHMLGRNLEGGCSSRDRSRLKSTSLKGTSPGLASRLPGLLWNLLVRLGPSWSVAFVCLLCFAYLCVVLFFGRCWCLCKL